MQTRGGGLCLFAASVGAPWGHGAGLQEGREPRAPSRAWDLWLGWGFARWRRWFCSHAAKWSAGGMLGWVPWLGDASEGLEGGKTSLMRFQMAP